MKYLFYILLFISSQNLFGQPTHEVALLLPFNNKLTVEYNQTAAWQLGEMCRNYYRGMLLAMDSLSKAETKITLRVYDTENDSLVTAKILQKKEFLTTSLIYGPVMQGGNKMVSSFARQQKIYQISPLMTFSKTKIGDEYWVAANPDLPSYGNILSEKLLSTTTDTIQFLIISDNSLLDKAITPVLKKIAVDNKRLKVKVIDANADIDINSFYSIRYKNCVLINSSKEQTVNKWLYRINDTTQFIFPEVYGYNQWFEFRSFDIALCQKKNVRIISPSFVDYTRHDVIQFVKSFRDRYGIEPTEEAFKGFDQGLYFTSLLIQNGKKLFSNYTSIYQALHTSYLYQKDKDGQYKSKYLNILKFESDRLIAIY
jgi:hypothetical protein